VKLCIRILAALFTACLALAACSIHSVDVQQGNIIEPKMVAQLQIGMTRKQVEFIMGKPVLMDAFHQDRWDYIYFGDTARDMGDRNHITLYFDGNKLARIENDSKDTDNLPAPTPP